MDGEMRARKLTDGPRPLLPRARSTVRGSGARAGERVRDCLEAQTQRHYYSLPGPRKDRLLIHYCTAALIRHMT